MPNPKHEWSEADIATLKRMWAEGASAADISFAIRGSPNYRNSILGKAHRLKLSKHQNAHGVETRIRKTPTPSGEQTIDAIRAKARERYKIRKEAADMAKPKAPAVVIEKIKPRPVVNDGMPVEADERYMRGRAWQPLPDTTPVALEDLPRKGACRWPVTPDSPFMFCAAIAHEGSVYCPTHKHLSTRRL